MASNTAQSSLIDKLAQNESSFYGSLVWRCSLYTDASLCLEAEPGLHLYDPRSQCSLGLSKVCVHDVGLRVVEVELVEQIIEVGAELDPRTFSQDLHRWQAERFAESGVHVEIAGTVKRVALDSRRRRQRTITLLALRTNRGVRVGKQTSEQRAGHHGWRCKE